VYVPDIDFHEASTLEEAAAAVSRHAPDVRLLAGGTDLLVDLKTGRVGFRHLVSISRINALRGVTEHGGNLRIGALTTITQLGRSPAVRERFSPIVDATSRMAAPQIRNMATSGGNLASAVPCADLPPILRAMNASVEIWSPRGRRSVLLDEFFVGVRETVLARDEILTAIHVPKPPEGFGAAYARFGLREGNTIAVASVAASLQLDGDDTISGARVVLGAVAPTPMLAEGAGGELIGRKPTAASFRRAAEIAMTMAAPICDVRGSVDFRRELVRVLTVRALDTAHRRAREDQ
jgi:carbon-monoxide dehydrogenase medium subunit